MFPVPALKSAFIQRGMVYFSWKFYLENTQSGFWDVHYLGVSCGF